MRIFKSSSYLHIIISSYLFVGLLSIHSYAYAQDTLKPKREHKEVYHQDLVDVFHKIFHSEASLRFDTGAVVVGKPRVSIFPAVGYTLQTGFAAILSSSVAFYLSDKPYQKMSNVFASVSYSQYNQIIFPIQSSIWTKDNKYNFVGDWRYMKYPSLNYGLGTYSELSDGYRIDFSYFRFHQTVFKNISGNLYGGLGYYLDNLWNVREVDPPANKVTDYQKYGLFQQDIASGVAFRLLYDSRLNQINPENGFYANVVFRPNFKAIGSSSNWQSLLFDFRKYFCVSKRTGNVLAFWSYNWFSMGGNPPYILLPSTGWDDGFNSGRGYIQGRYRDRNMLYLEAEYRFRILRNGLLGGVLFTNVQTYAGEVDKGFQMFVPAVGTGLRIKLNKFSGSNLSIDYGVGLEGSRGFFVNLNEIF